MLWLLRLGAITEQPAIGGFRAPLWLLGLRGGDGVQPALYGFGSALWFIGGAPIASGITAGDHVQVVQQGGTLCQVTTGGGTPVKVVLASAKKITVVTQHDMKLQVTI